MDALATVEPWRLDRLPLYQYSIPYNASCGVAFEAMVADPNVPGIAVLDGTTLRGLVDRQRLMQTFARPVLRDVYERRPATLLMDWAPLVTDIRTTISELSARISHEKPSAMWSGFAIMERGRFKGIGTALDLLRLHTEESRAHNQQIEAARAEIAKAYAVKSLFLANMSHELRTPLNAIIGFADLISQASFGTGPDAWSRYQLYADDIANSGRFLLQLINDILDLSKIEAGRAELSESEIEVGALITTCLRFFNQRAADAGVELRVEPAPDIDTIWGDELKLTQVLNNLVGNAVKFTASGGRVTVRTAQLGDESFCLTVEDTGVGIPIEAQERVFEPFTQASSNVRAAATGTGLGLPLVRRLIELHDGRVELESEPGRGTVVNVILPANRICATDPTLPETLLAIRGDDPDIQEAG